jgi:hypothetical protein
MPGDLTSVFAALICAGFVTAAESGLIPLRRGAAVALPNTQSSHSVPTSRCGAPIAVGLVLAALLLMHGTVAITFAVPVAAFAAIGFADDLAGLPARRRLLQGLPGLALKDARHVWSKKPLALPVDDLEAAWEVSGRQFMAGFNSRRFPAAMTARNWLAEIAGPKFLVYRVAVGPIPDGGWCSDRRQCGRIRDEVCHFIDHAQALIGADIEQKLGGKTFWRGRQDMRPYAFKQVITRNVALPTRAMSVSTHAATQAAVGPSDGRG